MVINVSRRRVLLAAGVLTAASALVACATQSSRVRTEGTAASPLGQKTGAIPDGGASFGCDGKARICVDACTGAVLPHDPLRIGEGQQFAIRTVGWATCRPRRIQCISHDVPEDNVSFAGDAPEPLSDAGDMSGVAFDPLDAGTFDDAAATFTKRFSDKKAIERTQGNEALVEQMIAPCADANARTAELRARLSRVASTPGSALARHVASASRALADYEAAVTSACVPPADAGDAAPQVPEAGATDGEAPLPHKPVATKAVAGAAADMVDPQKQIEPLKRVKPMAQEVNRALSMVQSASARSAKGRMYEAESTELVTFGDCVITVPAGTTNRQIVVDVKMTPSSFCNNNPALATCPEEAAADGGSDDAGGDDDGGGGDDAGTDSGLAPATRDALVYAEIDHGRYYWDIGWLFAVVPDGQRTVVTPARPGFPGTQAIVVNESSPTLSGLALTIYPLGHRRQRYSFLEGSPPAWGDLLGLQLALNPNLTSALSTVFGGVVIEPITGLSFNAGAVALQGDFLRAGYTAGMVPSPNRSDYVTQSTMIRTYFGVTLGYELIHTTATKLPQLKQDLGD